MVDGDGDDARRLRRTDFSVLQELPHRWADDDVYGNVNNVVHYLMFDTAVNGWLIEAVGTDIRRLPAIGVISNQPPRSWPSYAFLSRSVAGLPWNGWAARAWLTARRCSASTAPNPPPLGGSCTCTWTRTPAGRTRSGRDAGSAASTGEVDMIPRRCRPMACSN